MPSSEFPKENSQQILEENINIWVSFKLNSKKFSTYKAGSKYIWFFVADCSNDNFIMCIFTNIAFLMHVRNEKIQTLFHFTWTFFVIQEQSIF